MKLSTQPEGWIKTSCLSCTFSITYSYTIQTNLQGFCVIVRRRKEETPTTTKTLYLNTTTKSKTCYSEITSKGFFLLLEKES